MADLPQNCSSENYPIPSMSATRPRFTSGFDLRKCREEGAIMEVDSGFHYPLDEDDDEEIYDTDILSSISISNGRDKTTVAVMPGDKAALEQRRLEYFHSYDDSYSEMEKHMTPLPEYEGYVVYKEIKRAGDGGGKIPDRCKVYYHFTAFVEGNPVAVDTSFARKFPYVTDLRKSNLLPGMEIALKSMEVGEISKFVVPPALAFRECGVPPRIPPNSKILYNVELLQKIDEELLKTFQHLSTEERSELPFEQIVSECMKLRREGNAFYSEMNYAFAMRKWRKAINILEDYSILYEKDEIQRSELVWSLYSNLANTYLKLQKPAQACNACKIGLKSAAGPEQFAIMYMWFAKAKIMLKDVQAAAGLVRQGLEQDPDNSKLLEVEKQIKAEEKRQNSSYRQMCQNMFKPSPKASINQAATTTPNNGQRQEMKPKFNAQVSTSAGGQGTSPRPRLDVSIKATEDSDSDDPDLSSRGEMEKKADTNESSEDFIDTLPPIFLPLPKKK